MRCALIHGFAGSRAAWDDVIAAWQLPEPPLAIALPGHEGGGSVRSTWDDNLDVVAKAIAGCDVAVGYSLGARVALGLVVSGRVPRAVLIGVNPGVADADREERRAADHAWANRARQGIEAFIAAWEAQPLFATQARAPAGRRAARREHRRELDPEQVARSLEVMGLAAMPDYWSAMPAHRDRIALLAGADDAKYVAISQALPAAFFETIPDSGHDPTLEQPVALAGAIARAI